MKSASRLAQKPAKTWNHNRHWGAGILGTALFFRLLTFFSWQGEMWGWEWEVLIRFGATLVGMLGYMWLKDRYPGFRARQRKLLFFYAIGFLVGLGVIGIIGRQDDPWILFLHIEQWVFIYYLGKLALILYQERPAEQMPRLENVIAIVLSISLLIVMILGLGARINGWAWLLEPILQWASFSGRDMGLLGAFGVSVIYSFLLHKGWHNWMLPMWVTMVLAVVLSMSSPGLLSLVISTLLFVLIYYRIPFWKIAVLALVPVVPLLLMRYQAGDLPVAFIEAFVSSQQVWQASLMAVAGFAGLWLVKHLFLLKAQGACAAGWTRSHFLLLAPIVLFGQPFSSDDLTLALYGLLTFLCALITFLHIHQFRNRLAWPAVPA